MRFVDGQLDGDMAPEFDVAVLVFGGGGGSADGGNPFEVCAREAPDVSVGHDFALGGGVGLVKGGHYVGLGGAAGAFCGQGCEEGSVLRTWRRAESILTYCSCDAYQRLTIFSVHLYCGR